MMKGKYGNFYYRISMKNKWIIFICVIIIYEIVLMGFFGYRSYENVLGDYFIEGVQKDVSNVTEQLEDKLKSLEDFAKKLQYDEYIYKFIREKENVARNIDDVASIPYRTLPEYELKKDIERHINSILLSRPEIRLASIQFIKDPERIYTVTRNKSYAEELSFMEMNIYDKKLEKDDDTLYYIDDNKDIYIVQKIKSRDTFKHSANIVLKIDRSLLLTKLESMLEGAKKGVYVVGFGDKEILRYGEVSYEHKSQVDNYVRDGVIADVYPGENPKKEIIVYDTIETNNQEIGVAVLIFRDILFQEVRNSIRKITNVLLITTPFILLLAYKLYKDIIEPIYDLSAKMHQIEEGEIGVMVESDRKDEIGVLFRSFNKMSNQINYLVNRVYKEQLAVKNSEIRALQSQINPHFLYNTLEIINWSARLEGADEVADMIEALAGIMEINIDRKNERLLAIEEEIKYTNHYIFLIKKRFGDKIKFQNEICEEIMDYKVPRLILQPIIENAIEHGVEPVGKGTVTIRINKIGDELIIEIEDTGQGIKEEEMSKIQYNLDNWAEFMSKKIESTSKGKIGVLNVHSRLKLIYGEKSGIEISSIYGEGSIMKMRIPIIEQES